MARDAASRGDTIEAENFYQHAEHYFRVLREQNSSRAEIPQSDSLRSRNSAKKDGVRISGPLAQEILEKRL
jgi:hypothetical protein